MRIKLFFIFCIAMATLANATEHKVIAPSQKLSCVINIDNQVSYMVKSNNDTLISWSKIGLSTDTKVNLGENPKLKKVSKIEVNQDIEFVVPRKFTKTSDWYNQQTFEFSNNYSLQVRAYDDAVAYRWITNFKAPFTVTSELAQFNFTKNSALWFPEDVSVYSHQERTFKQLNFSDIEKGKFCPPPALVSVKNYKVLISEADLYDYTGLYLRYNGKNGFDGMFPGYPLETLPVRDRDVKVTKYANYLAKVQGDRSFPWRVVIVAENDAQLLTNETIYKLSRPMEIADPSWIKPGKVAWDWWNANNIYGVDFESGLNTETYKYYIDFASKYGLEYIILDEGWYYLEDVLKVKEEIDIKALVAYGKSKNVDLILWVTWKALDDKLDEALKTFELWGIKGIKVDFMQRDDQWMVNYYWKVAKKAAEHKLLVDFHGAFKPTGLHRAYPNFITQEGVMGMEFCKWSANADPEHNVTIPFTRMVLGPIDYTPGAMKNATKENFSIVFTEPMSPGTRCHQLAMYVVFESPLQMLSDNPSNYLREPECMEFLARVPSIWDETKVLQAQVGDYVAMARKRGNTWYLGAMTDWTERTLSINFDFLPAGNYTLKSWNDGINANKHASDFKVSSTQITNLSKLDIRLAQGGGWAAIIEKN